MRQHRGAAAGTRRAARAARHEAWLLAQQRYKRTYANEQGPYPVPLSPATIVSCVVAAALV